MSVDLFGMDTPVPQQSVPGKRKEPIPRGYAFTPGTGPAGETCSSCKHVRRIRLSAKTINKCYRFKTHWTHGRGSDVLARSPACRHWEAPDG